MYRENTVQKKIQENGFLRNFLPKIIVEISS